MWLKEADVSYRDGREEYFELEEELKRLPKGSIVHKTISGRSYLYQYGSLFSHRRNNLSQRGRVSTCA